MTNGIVSITRGGKTILKFITGCDGYNADALSVSIRRFIMANGRIPNGEESLVLASGAGFGCDDCCVIQDARRVYMVDSHEEADTLALYLKNGPFEKPEFNPRWDAGTAAHVCTIEMEEFELAVSQ